MSATQPWSEELQLLRTILDKSELQPAIKWGMDVYTWQGKNVVGFIGFKNHFALWFYNGIFLSDPYKVLVNAQKEVTKAMLQWRFSSIDEIDETRILDYVREAIENEKAGRSWKPQKSTEREMPELLTDAFLTNPELEEAFQKLSPYKQKEYIDHIVSAKREETRIARLEKIVPMILEGKGLNDRYK